MERKSLNMIEFYRDFITLTDIILPTLSPSEALVLIQLFSRSIAVDESDIKISLTKISKLTQLTLPTIVKALDSLTAKGILSVVSDQIGRKSKIYRLTIKKDSFAPISKVSRDPLAMLQTAGVPAYVGILDKLTPEDNKLATMLMMNLEPEEHQRYETQARLEGFKRPDDINRRIKELVVIDRFGKERLHKYGLNADLF